MELIGTPSSISQAEKLITAVIAEVDKLSSCPEYDIASLCSVICFLINFMYYMVIMKFFLHFHTYASPLQADAGGSPSLVARGIQSAQAAGVGDQLEMQVPNEKVVSHFQTIIHNFKCL